MKCISYEQSDSASQRIDEVTANSHTQAGMPTQNTNRKENPQQIYPNRH